VEIRWANEELLVKEKLLSLHRTSRKVADSMADVGGSNSLRRDAVDSLAADVGDLRVI
jgi:hypothetical protein